jgi:hypothetical protein
MAIAGLSVLSNRAESNGWQAAAGVLPVVRARWQCLEFGSNPAERINQRVPMNAGVTAALLAHMSEPFQWPLSDTGTAARQSES